jgi:protein-S-isoprenylcysteine O-methyltransferase Ste14
MLMQTGTWWALNIYGKNQKDLGSNPISDTGWQRWTRHFMFFGLLSFSAKWD